MASLTICGDSGRYCTNEDRFNAIVPGYKQRVQVLCEDVRTEIRTEQRLHGVLGVSQGTVVEKPAQERQKHTL